MPRDSCSALHGSESQFRKIDFLRHILNKMFLQEVNNNIVLTRSFTQRDKSITMEIFEIFSWIL